MNHCMLDLETMGNGNRAAIIAIGAVIFDVHNVEQDGFYAQVSLDSSVRQGLEMDTSTILWWLQQSDAARAAFKGNESAESLIVVLNDFANWLSRWNTSRIQMWGNGAAFDNTILSAAYRKCGIEQPWKFWNDRCYRTMKALFPNVECNRFGTHHNALDDARTQAWHLIEICEKHGVQL